MFIGGSASTIFPRRSACLYFSVNLYSETRLRVFDLGLVVIGSVFTPSLRIHTWNVILGDLSPDNSGSVLQVHFTGKELS